MVRNKIYPVKSSIITYLIVLIVINNSLFSQCVNVPLEHWGYDFVERMEIQGFYSGLLTRSYPLTRTDFANILKSIETNKDKLTKTEQNIFEQLKGEFREELAKINTYANPQLYEKHLITWQEGFHNAKFDADFAQLYNSKREGLPKKTSQTSQTKLGGIIRGQFGNYLNFYIHARNSLNRGSEITQERFDPREGVPLIISGKNVYSDDAWAYITLANSWFLLEFGRDQLKWGPGLRGSLMISEENPLFEMIKLKFRFNRFQFTSFHGSLHSGIGAKYITGHRLELKVLPWLHVSGSETVVYGNRNIEASYLNPIMPYHVAEHHLGDKDNNTMAFDITAFPIKNHKFYFELFLDDFTTAENPFTYYGNKFAFLLGHRWTNPFGIPNTDIKWEYTRIEPFVYTHKDSINTYQNYNSSIGHWLGPDADDLFFEADYLLSRDLKLGLMLERIRHGKGDINTAHEITDGTQKKFLSGTVESEWSFGFSVTDQVFRDIFISMSYYYNDTKNFNKIENLNTTGNYANIQLSVNW